MITDEPNAKRQRKDEFDIVESLNVGTSTSGSHSGLTVVGEAIITSYTPEGPFVEISENVSDGDV